MPQIPERSNSDKFIRVPTRLLDALIQARFSAGQWRVLLWVLRYTYGWHRRRTRFTWYRIAQDLQMDRPAVYRAGKALLQANVLTYAQASLAVQTDCGRWNDHVGKRQKRCRQATVDNFNRSVVRQQRKRCQGTTLFRRAKDSSKDRRTAVVGARFVDNYSERRIYEGEDQRPTPVEELLNHGMALQGKAYTNNETAAFYRRFKESAKSC